MKLIKGALQRVMQLLVNIPDVLAEQLVEQEVLAVVVVAAAAAAAAAVAGTASVVGVVLLLVVASCTRPAASKTLAAGSSGYVHPAGVPAGFQIAQAFQTAMKNYEVMNYVKATYIHVT